MIDVILSPTQLILALGLLLCLSILASKISDRFGVPTLIVFLGIGMLAGSDGIGGIYFDNAKASNIIGIFTLIYILYSGGLDTNWVHVRPVLWQGLILSTIGVSITAALVGFFVWKVLGMSLLQGLLLGTIISSTDAAAVFSILRSRSVGLKGSLKQLLELESGSNDPMAVLLTVMIIDFIMSPTQSVMSFIPTVVLSLAVGLLTGIGVGYLAVLLFNKLRLDYEGLFPVLSMSVALLAYSIAEMFTGNGFLSVYVCGIYMGSKDFFHKRYLTKFHDGLGWLSQIILFLVLGLLVFPKQLPEVALLAISIAFFLMFVARPTAVYLGLVGSNFTIQEKTLIAWTGLRGAVPIVLATYPFTAGYEHSTTIFNIVFFVVLTSAIIQGKSLMMVARWLKVDAPLIAKPKSPIEFEKRSDLQSETREIEIPPEAYSVGKKILELELPDDVLILLIRRGQDFVVPKGKTTLEAYDTLTLIATRKKLQEANLILIAQKAELFENSIIRI